MQGHHTWKVTASPLSQHLEDVITQTFWNWSLIAFGEAEPDEASVAQDLSSVGDQQGCSGAYLRSWTSSFVPLAYLCLPGTGISKSITLTNPGFADLSGSLMSFDYLSFVWGFVSLFFRPIQVNIFFKAKSLYARYNLVFAPCQSRHQWKTGTPPSERSIQGEFTYQWLFPELWVPGACRGQPSSWNNNQFSPGSCSALGRVQTEVPGSQIRRVQGYNSS